MTTDSPPARTPWTPARQPIFLAALLDTGSVTFAAKAGGMSRYSASRLRARLKGTRSTTPGRARSRRTRGASPTRSRPNSASQ